MMRFWAVLILLAVHATGALAQDETIPIEPELRLFVKPFHVLERGAYVQGQIRLRIVLLSPDPFEEINFRPPVVDGARSVTLSTPRTRTFAHYSRTGYGYETTLAIFPEHSGTLTIPTIEITGETVSGGGSSKPFQTRIEATVIQVHPIAPDFESDWWLVADDITLNEMWVPPTDTLRVGDTVERRVAMTATGVRLEQLPPLVQPEDEGYAIVGDTVTETVERTRDGVISKVERVWTLQILSDDVLEVQPVAIDYWNPISERAARATLPVQRVEPLPRDADGARQDLIAEAVATHQGRRLGVLSMLMIPVIIIGGFLGSLLYLSWPTRADRVLIRRTKETQDVRRGFAAVLDWVRRSFPRASGKPLSQTWTELDARGSGALARLQAGLFSPSAAPVDVEEAAREIASAGRRARVRAFLRRLAAHIARPFRARRLSTQARPATSDLGPAE